VQVEAPLHWTAVQGPKAGTVEGFRRRVERMFGWVERGTVVLVGLVLERIVERLLHTKQEKHKRWVVCWLQAHRCLKNSVQPTNPETGMISRVK